MRNSNKYTKQEKDVLELITHLILTKPVAVKKLLAKHGVIFSFRPKRKDLINQVVEQIKERNTAFMRDLERLLSIHLKHKGLEIMALETGRTLFNKEDEDGFLGGLIGGVAKGALGALGGLFGVVKVGGTNEELVTIQFAGIIDVKVMSYVVNIGDNIYTGNQFGLAYATSYGWPGAFAKALSSKPSGATGTVKALLSGGLPEIY